MEDKDKDLVDYSKSEVVDPEGGHPENGSESDVVEPGSSSAGGEGVMVPVGAKEVELVRNVNHFVNGVVTRDIAIREGVDTSKVAHIFHKEGEGGNEIHITGDASVVEPIGDVLEKGGFQVKEWHTTRPPLEKVKPELRELIDAIAHSAAAEVLRDAGYLPAGELLEEGARVIHEFKQGGEHDKE